MYPKSVSLRGALRERTPSRDSCQNDHCRVHPAFAGNLRRTNCSRITEKELRTRFGSQPQLALNCGVLLLHRQNDSSRRAVEQAEEAISDHPAVRQKPSEEQRDGLSAKIDGIWDALYFEF